MKERVSRGRWWLGGLVAGCIGGLGDGLATIRHVQLAPNPARDAILIGLSWWVGMVTAGLAGWLLPWLARNLSRPWPRSRWSSFVCGATTWAVLCLGTAVDGAWSFVPILLFAALPSVVHRDAGRPRMVVAFGFLALLAVRVADDDRPRDRHRAPTDPGPDVVLVVVDGLRADQLDRVPAGDLVAMPQLRSLAELGTRFSRATTPVTTRQGAQRAVLTGEAPWTSSPGAGWGAELRQKGWRTAIFGGADSGELADEIGFGVRDLDPGWLAGASAGTPGRLWQRWHGVRDGRRAARRVVEAWQGWMASLPSDRPAVSVLVFSDLVWPTRPSPPWDTAYQTSTVNRDTRLPGLGACMRAAEAEGLNGPADVRAAYDGAAAGIDALLPEVWSAASARPRGALLIVVGSRGTPMGDDARWLGATGQLHPSEMDVPIVVIGGDVPKGSALGSPVSTTDVLATVRAILGLPALAEAHPLPGLVRGFPPRTVALSVGGDGGVVVRTADGRFRRGTDGVIMCEAAGKWVRCNDPPGTPIPVLAGVTPDTPLCLGSTAPD